MLQTELQQLRAHEVEYLKTLQPWKDEVSVTVFKVNDKITNFMATQMTVASLLDDPSTIELVNTARECADQMNKDLVGLQDNYTQFIMELFQILKSQKDGTSGSETSHK